MDFGIFVSEPEMAHTIYHVSRDDITAECGRSVKRMICVGMTDENDVGIQAILITFRPLLRRCCKSCYQSLRRLTPAASDPSADSEKKDSETEGKS